jgi:hypothetical protein
MASSAGLARRRADRRPSRRPQAEVRISRTSCAGSSVTEFHGCDNKISSSCQPPSPRVQGAFSGRARRRRRRRCTRRRQRDKHCRSAPPLRQCAPTAAVRPPLPQCAPTAAVRPPLRQCAPTAAAPPPLRQRRRRPQGKEGATDNGTVTTATAADRRVTTTAATAQRMEKSGGRFAPPRFSPYLAAKQRRPPDASSASGACKRARARQNVRITERMEQRIGGGSAPDVGDPPVIRRHPAGDPRLSAPKRTSSVRRPPCRAACPAARRVLIV